MDFDNKGVFYTDANELEMQKRVLNYRPTWDINVNYNASNENVTANFYPVNSALSMRDGDRVFTVMNDRSQSASALKAGTVEFMQNRRIPALDDKGMGEYLNELDQHGHGIRVPATYYVQIIDESKTPDQQRKVQLGKTDHPLQVVYSFDTEQKEPSKTFQQPDFYKK